MSALADALKDVEIFSDLNHEDRIVLADQMSSCRCSRGEILFREGDNGNEMYVVTAGSVGIYLTTEDAEEVMLTEIEAGSFFGEMSIIEQEPRSATCRALTECDLLVLSSDSFNRLTQRRPRIAMTVLKRMTSITTDRLGKTGALLSGMVRWGEDARRRATTDEMTGLFNRRFYDEALDSYVRKADVDRTSLSLAMFDLDRFGSLNKEYGEAFCDRLILEAVTVFKTVFKDEDILVRYGGDEFAFLMPGCEAAEAAARCGQVNEAFRRLRFSEHPELRLTCSLGVAAYPAQAADLADLKDKADQALYHAKEAGRDRTMVFDDPTS